MSLRSRIISTTSVLLAISLCFFSFFQYFFSRSEIVDKYGENLRHITSTAALSIDGAKLRGVRKAGDEKSPAFRQIRDFLYEVMVANDLTHETIYTFQVPQNDHLRFGVMLHEKPFIGDSYHMPAENRELLRRVKLGDSVSTGLYKDDNGFWLSAMSPVYDKSRELSGILQADFNVEKFLDAAAGRLQVLLLVSLGILAIGILISYFLSRRIVSPLRDLAEAMDKARKGDFTNRLETEQEGEIGDLAAGFNSLGETIHRMNRFLESEVSRGADAVAHSSEQISEVAEKLRKTANEQTGGMEKASSSLNQIHEALRTIEKNASEQKKRMNDAAGLITSLNRDFENMNLNVAEASGSAQAAREQAVRTNRSIKQTIEDMEAIQKKSDSLTQMIELLNTISEKLQMLSLNASIEASRDIKEGAGFAVVAREITELSDRTSRSTTQAVDTLRDVTKSIYKGAQSLKVTVQDFETIFHSISSLAGNLNQLKGKSRLFLESTGSFNQMLSRLQYLSGDIAGQIREALYSGQNVSSSLTALNRDGAMLAVKADEISSLGTALQEAANRLKNSVSTGNTSGLLEVRSSGF